MSCTSPCYFNHNYKAIVGWVASDGEETQVSTFTTSGSGAIPSGVTFQVPNVPNGSYTVMVTDFINTVFMTFQVT